MAVQSMAHIVDVCWQTCSSGVHHFTCN